MRGKIHIPTLVGAILVTCIAAVCFTHRSNYAGDNFIILNFAVCCAVKALGFWVCVLVDRIRGYGRAHFGICLAVSSAFLVLLPLVMGILFFSLDGTKGLEAILLGDFFVKPGMVAAFVLDLIVFCVYKLISEFRFSRLN